MPSGFTELAHQCQETYEIVELPGREVLERGHRFTRRQQDVLDLAGGELGADVGEVLTGTGVARVADPVAGQATRLREDGAARREFSSLATAGSPHRWRGGKPFLGGPTHRNAEREQLVLDTGSAVGRRVEFAVGDCDETRLARHEPSPGDFFEAESVRAEKPDRRDTGPLQCRRLDSVEREVPRCAVPLDFQVSGARRGYSIP